MKHDAILFDLDGTLLDTIGLYEKAYLSALREVDFELSSEEFTRIYYSNIHLAEHVDMMGLADKLDTIRNFRDNMYVELLRTKVTWFDDGKKFIESIAGTPTAIITGSWRFYVDAIEQCIPLSPYTDTIITTDDFRPHSKPEPHGLLMAAEKLNVDPAKCVYIGDQGFDVGAANNAGMTSVLVRREKYTRKGAEEEADIVTDSLEDLIDSV